MRIKRGINKSRKHKKVLELTKGYTMTNSKLIKRAKEAMVHAGQYNMAHRRHRRSQMKSGWLTTINAALTDSGLSYSKLKGHMSKANISLNTKMLAELAVSYPQQFTELVKQFSK
jgi:large subunit ribosomal protein L20